MGRKAKPVDLHVIEGTFNSTRHGGVKQGTGNESDPVPPYKLRKDQQKLWDQLVEDLWWNTRAESELLMMYVNLTLDRYKYDKGRACKSEWTPALMGRYTQIGSELGVGYAQRQKAPSRDTDGDGSGDFD